MIGLPGIQTLHLRLVLNQKTDCWMCHYLAREVPTPEYIHWETSTQSGIQSPSFQRVCPIQTYKGLDRLNRLTHATSIYIHQKMIGLPGIQTPLLRLVLNQKADRWMCHYLAREVRMTVNMGGERLNILRALSQIILDTFFLSMEV